MPYWIIGNKRDWSIFVDYSYLNIGNDIRGFRSK